MAKKRKPWKRTWIFSDSCKNQRYKGYVKPEIDKKQQKCTCRWYDDWDETINHIISKCSKLAQKAYKIRHDLMGKVIHGEVFKKFKFDRTNKSILDNETLKVL